MSWFLPAFFLLVGHNKKLYFNNNNILAGGGYLFPFRNPTNLSYKTPAFPDFTFQSSKAF